MDVPADGTADKLEGVAVLRTEAGALRTDMSRDNWHLNDAGYAELTRAVRETASQVGFPLQ